MTDAPTRPDRDSASHPPYSGEGSGERAVTASEITLPGGVRGLRLANETLAVTLLPDKGADIYELIYRPAGIDVLWKTPWGLKTSPYPSTGDSSVAFLDTYGGGWQVLFPNGGDACQYRGAELGFHGEAAVAVWDYEITEAGGAAAEARLSTRLRRSPFRIQRTVRVESGSPQLVLTEHITNESREPLEYMWSHHPAFGAPFLTRACRVDIPAATLVADDLFDGPGNPLERGKSYAWPRAGANSGIDLSRVTGEDEQRAVLAYFRDFSSGWYAITNTDLGFGVGITWPADIFPYAWLWQEMNASPGYPWYQSVYVMAIEPASSIPGQGLQAVMAKTGTQRTIEAGASVEIEMRAVFYESRAGVEHIDPNGRVRLKTR